MSLSHNLTSCQWRSEPSKCSWQYSIRHHRLPSYRDSYEQTCKQNFRFFTLVTATLNEGEVIRRRTYAQTSLQPNLKPKKMGLKLSPGMFSRSVIYRKSFALCHKKFKNLLFKIVLSLNSFSPTQTFKVLRYYLVT